jgi:hypothetical protein
MHSMISIGMHCIIMGYLLSNSVDIESGFDGQTHLFTRYFGLRVEALLVKTLGRLVDRAFKHSPTHSRNEADVSELLSFMHEFPIIVLLIDVVVFGSVRILVVVATICFDDSESVR